MKDPVLSYLETELAQAKQNVLSIEQQIAARRAFVNRDGAFASELPAVGNSTNSGAPVRSKKARSPIGYFRAAALKLFDGGDQLTAAKVRATLETSGYKYALTSNHVSRQLAEMVAGGDLTSKPNGAYTTYRKAKKKA